MPQNRANAANSGKYIRYPRWLGFADAVRAKTVMRKSMLRRIAIAHG
jgi:hypothetical protein